MDEYMANAIILVVQQYQATGDMGQLQEDLHEIITARNEYEYTGGDEYIDE